jgi:general secretion pathway protein L
MAQTILGLDLGSHSVKAVLIESTLRGWTVAGAARVPVPPSPPPTPEAAERPLRERQIDAVRALLAERGWRPDSVTAAVPGATAASHTITLPFTDQRRIEQTIAFEVEGVIPFDLADVAWDWQPMAERDGKSELYVAVIRKEELAGLLAALGPAELDPRVVVPAGPAYASLFGHGLLAAEPAAAEGAPPPVSALLDVGHERTSLCVVAAGVCEAARTFPFGAAQVVRALARELAIPEPDAASLLAAELDGAPPPEPLAALAAEPRAAEALRHALAPLVRELRASLRAWRARPPARQVGALLLAGELGRLPGLPELLAPEVEGPISTIALAGDPAQRIPHREVPAFALALALALRDSLGGRSARLNLRRGDLAFTRDFEHLKGRLVRLGIQASLVALLAIVGAGVQAWALSRQEAALDKALCEAEQKILGKCHDNYEIAVQQLRGKGSPVATIPKVTAVEVLAELTEKLPDGVSLKFDRVEITKDKLHVQGTTEAAENVDRLVGALRASRCFADARSGGARRRGAEGKFEFSADSSLTCVEGAQEPGRKP